MANCDLLDSCFFFNKPVIDMPKTIDYLKGKYCYGSFTECDIYMVSKVYGQDKVPRYLYPNSMTEMVEFDLPEPQEGMDMYIKILNADGTFGKVRIPILSELVKTGGIAAYHCSEGWIEVRRKQNIGYGGQERRTRVLQAQ